MSNFVRYVALALIIGLGAIFLIACDTQPPQQVNDCRVDEDHDSMDVLEGCSDDDDDFENSVEIDD